MLLAAAVGGWWCFAGQHCCSTAHGNAGGELDGFRNESIEMMDNPMQAAAAAATAAASAAAGADTLVNNPTLASPGPSANGPRGSGVVVESNQQAYFVPMLAEDDGNATGEDTYLVPSTAQAQAYEQRQVPDARDHRNHTNQIYAPPLAPPPTTPTAAPMDYSYIDEDDALGGSRVEVEYATAVDDAPLQQVRLDGGGYVEGGELPAEHGAVYAVPVAGGGGGGGGSGLVLDAGGYVAGSELMPSSSFYEEAGAGNSSA